MHRAYRLCLLRSLRLFSVKILWSPPLWTVSGIKDLLQYISFKGRRKLNPKELLS